jgi:3-oxoadipate enol-lactonase
MPRVITSNGNMIAYDLAGAGAATPIVFLHGVGSDKSAWAPQLKYFGETRRAVAFDYPGYGDSDPAPEGTTCDDYAEAILSAMHKLAIDSAHICGLSLGGVVAIAMGHFAPERCTSLILADTFALHPEGRAIYDRSIAASDNLRALAEARADVLLAQPADPVLRSEVIETMAKIAPAAYRIGAEAVWLADQRDRAVEIAAPTLVLCGAEDHITPPALSDELARFVPGAAYELIDRAGHLSNMERPEEFNSLVSDFIRSVEGH